MAVIGNCWVVHNAGSPGQVSAIFFANGSFNPQQQAENWRDTHQPEGDVRQATDDDYKTLVQVVTPITS